MALFVNQHHASAAANSPASLVFAVIGDYGMGNADESAVASLVRSWKPEFIVTLGDNNYPIGNATTIDRNVGHDYSDYIRPYTGAYAPTHDTNVTQNRFFPSPGNHDWMPNNLAAYLSYFSGAYSLVPAAGGTPPPSQASYYHYHHPSGFIDLFSLDSNLEINRTGVAPSSSSESTSPQAAWLWSTINTLNTLQTQPSWRLVYFHHPPYSSAAHGDNAAMQWQFEQHGIHAVLGGHDHSYERLSSPFSSTSPVPYIVNGLGGAPRYEFTHFHPLSRLRYNAAFGAQRVTVNRTHLMFEFMGTSGVLIDAYMCVNQTAMNLFYSAPALSASASSSWVQSCYSTGPYIPPTPTPTNSPSSSSSASIPSAARVAIAIILSLTAITGVIFLFHSLYRMRRQQRLRQHGVEQELPQQQQRHQARSDDDDLGRGSVSSSGTAYTVQLNEDARATHILTRGGSCGGRNNTDNENLLANTELDDVALADD